jgi:hypothetical protein
MRGTAIRDRSELDREAAGSEELEFSVTSMSLGSERWQVAVIPPQTHVFLDEVSG